MTEYYKEQLKRGNKYQQFVNKIFIDRYNINLDFYLDKENQLKGECFQGIEIKYNSKLSKIKCCWIEVKEKSNPNNVNYVASGIYRKDNTWLYVCGDYNHIFIFSKKRLKEIFESGLFIEKEIKKKTSKGFVLKRDDILKYCILHIEV